jgi:hypothetical protein
MKEAFRTGSDVPNRKKRARKCRVFYDTALFDKSSPAHKSLINIGAGERTRTADL